MADTSTPLKIFDEVEQAIYFHGRERRKSLAGVPELFRTSFSVIPTTPLLATQFPTRDTVITFQTSIRINAGASTGLIFELGDATTAIAAWINTDGISLRAGGSAAADRALADFDNGAALPTGLELDLVFAIRPGDGRARIWANGTEIARDTASGGQFPSSLWAASSNGAFAAAAVGALPADVLETGAPTNFEVIQSLSAFVSQVPRHFV